MGRINGGKAEKPETAEVAIRPLPQSQGQNKSSEDAPSLLH